VNQCLLLPAVVARNSYKLSSNNIITFLYRGCALKPYASYIIITKYRHQKAVTKKQIILLSESAYRVNHWGMCVSYLRSEQTNKSIVTCAPREKLMSASLLCGVRFLSFSFMSIYYSDSYIPRILCIWKHFLVFPLCNGYIEKWHVTCQCIKLIFRLVILGVPSGYIEQLSSLVHNFRITN